MAHDPTAQSPSSPAQPPARSRVANKALWALAIGLLANAAVLLYTHSTRDLSFSPAAFAQAAPAERMVGAKGIYMMPAQLGPNHFGLYLMDVDAGTITVYVARPDNSRFKLMAVRSFRYDRYLDDLNNDPPTPKDVQKLVQQQRQREELEGKKEPTKDTIKDEPKPDTRPE